MRRALLGALLLPVLGCGSSGSTERPPTTTPPPPTGGFTLAWSDEFEGPSGALVDATKWTMETGGGGWGNQELETYTSATDNVHLDGQGHLVIRVLSAAGTYSSARLKTQGRFTAQYGHLEASIKLPAGRGIWPAFWMLGANITTAGWPACGEIDVMENVGFDPLRVHASVHTAAYNHTIGTQKTASTLVADPAADFHVYAMEWYPDRIETFVDGARYFSFRNEGTGTRSWPFDETQYLLINLALGGAWGGQQGIDDSRFPHRYLVDYVRIYQQR